MKKTIMLLLLLSSTIILYCQDSNLIDVFVKNFEKGSMEVKYQVLLDAVDMGIEGKVFIKFVVDKSGNITNPTVIKGIYADCDNEALRVVASAPKWKPGKQRGKPVNVQVIVPILFIIQERSM